MLKGLAIIQGILIILISFFYSTGTIAHAEMKTIISEGTARVGENETEVQAKHRAWLDAQRKALEEAGVVIASSTTVTNFEVIEDWIHSTAVARVQTKLLSETRSLEDNLVVLRVTLECKVDTDDIALLNKELQNVITSKNKKYAPGNPIPKPASPTAEQVKDFILPDGSIYTGTMVEGLPDGQGVKRFSGGGKYEGAFRKGFRQGTGTMIWPNGDRYCGHWLSDMRSGRGEFTSVNGEKQIGRWLNDIFYGE